MTVTFRWFPCRVDHRSSARYRYGPLIALVLASTPGFAAEPAAVSAIQCRWATGPIEIDGRADEETWNRAQLVEGFRAHWADQPARSATRARLLWDDDHLYFFAEMEDADLYADITEHDGMIWLNDVFELFFKPSDGGLGYYEFQVNAAGTVLDMYLASRGSGAYGRWKSAQPFHIESAVVRRGTLNDWNDADDGWSVEGCIPWSDFEATGGRPSDGDRWRFTLCRYDYSVAFERPDLTTVAPLSRPDFHYYEDYVPLHFVGQK